MKKTFFAFKKIILLTFILCFTFTFVYVPQPFTEIKEAQAIAGVATELWQTIQNISLGNIAVFQAIAAVGSFMTGRAITSIQVKELLLDKIAFTLAKNILSAMTRSIVRWINSGFKGSPAFVQDLQGFILNVADETFGQFLEELGGPFSIVCSPFRLDVQLSLTLSYNRLRDPSKSRCTLTGALQNIQNFIGGNMQQGGWPAWFDIVSQPNLYTPYGQTLSANIEARARILNAQGREINLLSFGSGFQSSRICERVTTALGGTRNECFISTPGRVISEALTFQLSVGPRTLIEADEINEIIGALLSQLAQQVLTGTGGLFGMTKSSGYSNPNFNVDTYGPGIDTPASTFAGDRDMLNSALAIEQEYYNLAVTMEPQLASANYTDPMRQSLLLEARAEIAEVIPRTQANIIDLQGLIIAYNDADALPNVAEAEARKLEIIGEFGALRTLHSAEQVAGSKTMWEGAIRPR